MSKLIIGLTGGIGSGKSTVSDMFATKQIDIIDADIIARDVVAPQSEALIAIKQHFGATFIQRDGQLNRVLLRSRIFANEADKHWLNDLLHPIIHRKITMQTRTAQSPYCVLVAPLLIENNLLGLVDRVLVVDVSEATQLNRTLARDKTSSAAEIKAIMASQINRAERLKSANEVINNDECEITQVQEKVTKLHQQYLKITEALQ